MEKYSDLLPVIQQLQVESIKKMNVICEKYGLQYWAIGGTLLGAIRHKGFIPWDDDIDIAMTKEDFIKLKNIPCSEWGDKFLFCAPDMDCEIHDKFFARIYIKNSRVQSEKDVLYWKNWSDNKPWSTSLMCDIFVYEHVPEDKDKYLKIHKKCDIYRFLYSITRRKPYSLKGPISTKINRAFYRLIAGILRKIYKEPWKTFDSFADKAINAGYKGGDMLGIYRSGHPLTKMTYLKNEIFPLEKKPFEDTYIYVPKEWDMILTKSYGDYMTPPPVSKRGHLSPSFLDLGDGVEHIFSDPLPGSLGDHSK